MKCHRLPPVLLGLFVWTGVITSSAAPFSDRLLRDEGFWGDGKAEVVVFDAEEKRYGTLRKTEVRHILVRENFAADETVKADNWQAPGTYPVIKLNQVITIPTGSYRYDQGHSAFWRQDSGELIKFTSTTNDSCGLSYKHGLIDGDRWHYRAFTYWEGMSEVEERQSAPANALLYDELPFKLRTVDFGKITLFEAPLMDSTIDSKADPLAWSSAAFAIARTPDGWRVTVKHRHGTDRLFFDHKSPHTLKRWQRWDGSSLERRHSIRIPYWQLNQPGDERYLKPGTTHP
ncbi:MAG: hypothetical protein SynsKO_22060 [Synoicihabitans sp.]